MSFLQKNKNCIYLFLIVILGTLIRLWHLDKPEGMWFDEMNTFLEAKMPFEQVLKVFFTSHIHTPLYYVILHFWMNIFGESDFTLRLLPVIFGTLIIPVVYLCGRELKCDKTALWAAFFTAINSLLIYYSQEMRFYSLTALFSALITLFILRINNNPSKTNITGLTLANAGLLYTHSISFIFVFFEFLIFGLYFALKKKNSFKPLFLSGFFTIILYSPYLYFRFFKLVSAGISNPGITTQWWSKFTFSKILFAFGDTFSPFLLGNINPPDNYLDFMFKSPAFAVLFSFLVIIPVIIGLYGLISSVIKQKEPNLLLFLLCFCFISVFTIASMMGKVVYISRYLIEITPIFILLFSYGLVNTKNKFLSGSFISLFIIINLFCLFLCPMSAVKTKKASAFKLPADVINKYNITANDRFIFIGYKKLFLNKYLKANSPDFSYHLENWNLNYFPWFLSGDLSFKDVTNLGHLAHYNRHKYFLTNKLPENIYKKRQETLDKIIKTKNYKNFLIHTDSKEYSYNYYKGLLSSGENILSDTKFNEEILSKINNDNRLIIVILRSLAVINNPTEIKALTQNTYEISKEIPLMFLLHSRISFDILEMSNKTLELEKQEKAGAWEIYTFRKQQ